MADRRHGSARRSRPSLEKHKLPLIASYGGPNLTDPAQRRASIDRTVATAKLVKKYGGKVIVFGPNGVPRDKFNFAEAKAGIVDVLNEGAKAVVDLGLTPCCTSTPARVSRRAKRPTP